MVGSAREHVIRLEDCVPERLDWISHEAFYESANLHRLVAFVGSGLSLVYGSLTWPDFMASILEISKDAVGRALGLANDPQDDAIIEDAAERQRLKHLLRVSERQLKLFDAKNKEPVVTLEICQQAFRAVERFYKAAGRSPPGAATFGEALQEVFRSDAYFVRRSLSARLKLALRADDLGSEPLQAILDETCDSSKALAEGNRPGEDGFQRSVTRTASAFYSGAMIGRLVADDSEIAPLARRLIDTLEAQGDRNAPLPIDRRSILNILMAKKIVASGDLLGKEVLAVGDPGAEGTRLASPRPLLDPIHNMSRDLGIRRYLTTNYDIELEQYFIVDDVRDRERLPPNLSRLPHHSGTSFGSSAPTDASWLRDRADGGQVASDVYADGNSAGLIDFAVGNSNRAAHIYHLHGRADLPETMVATESDYNRIYWHSGRDRSDFDRAYEVLLAGNPIVFVGSGLAEVELNRLLRQQVSDAASRDDAFVLWMARDRAEQLTRQQTSLRTKFSVHTLHFGHPRRGSGVSLRRHQIAIDLVARKFGIAGKAADWDDCASDVDQLLMQEAAALLVSAGDGQIRLPDDHMGDCDLKDVKAILGLGSAPYSSLVRESTDPQSFGHELTLLSTLDLDADVFAWLLSKDSNDFASAVRNAPRTTGPADANANANANANAQKLIAEYLHKLDQKIVTAALRVEIRELGREKNRFFLDRATPVQPRSVTIADEKDKHLPMVRHISAEAGLYAPPDHCRELMLDEMVIRPAGWRQFDISPDRFTNAATFIVGAVGCGKGAFLRLLLEQCKPRIGTQGNAIWSSALFVNCCFGQEFDSVLSLVEEFLDPDRRIRTDEEPARSRRDRIETALDDLGANRGPRLLIAFGAIDRLFGLEGELLSTDCHWLFKALIRCRRIDLVVTGSEKVLPYIARRKREYLKRKGHNPSRFRMFEVSRSKSSVAAMVGSTSAQTDASEPNEGNDGTQAGQNTLAPAISFIGQLRKQGRERDRKARNLNVRFGVHEDVAADDVDDDALESMRLSGGRRDRLIIEREIDGLMRDDAGKPTNRDFGTLAQEILKVLAFIGLPVEGEVLITPPGVRNQVDILTRGKLKEDKSSSNLAIKDGVFLAALDLLLSRKLVTTIEPYGFRPAEPFEAVEPDASKGVADVNRILHEIDDGVGDRPVRRSFPIDKKGRTPAQHAILHRHRFALHRSILAYVRSRHDVPIGETTLSDCFNMTLFVAQPDDIPTPRPQLASELAELVDWLQRGWKDVELSKSRITDEIAELKKGIEENYYGDPRNPTRERRLRELVKLMQMRGSLAPASLRAAGGIVRSFFSAATLFGLDVTDMHGRLTPAGAITAHKQRIREMLNAAFLMQSAREPQCDKFQKAWNDHLVSRVTIPNPVSSGSDLNHEYEMFDTNQREKLDTILEFFSETQPWSDARPESEKWKTTRYCDHAIVPRWARMAGVAQASPKAVFGSAAPSNDLARRPFYADEVAWMHNERAVMALGQGDLYSAQTSFHLALQANEAIEGTEYQPNRCRILLNKALVQIERGRIREAWHELKRLRNAIDSQKPHRPNSVDPDTLEHGRIFWLATGYMGLCEHLNGQVDLARDSYDAALKWLIAHGEHRAVAMFSMHRASLLQSGVGDYDGAMEGYRIALAAAESGPHADLAYLIQVSRTGLQVSKLARRLGKAPTPEEPLEMLSRAIRYGELLDMYRVTAFARNVRAALRLDLGDVEAAEIDIARALAIAARCGMKLRRISLRLLKGRAYTIRGSLDNARLMYQTALSEAEVHGYQQGIHQARDGLKRVLSSGQLEKLER